MPVTIKTAAMKYKNSGGTYVGIDAVAETTTSQQVTAINNAGAAQVAAVQAQGATTIASIPQDYTTLSNNVSDLQSAFIEDHQLVEQIPNKAPAIKSETDKAYNHSGLTTSTKIKFYGNSLAFDNARYADRKNLFYGQTKSTTSGGVSLSVSGNFIVFNSGSRDSATNTNLLTYNFSPSLPAGSYSFVKRRSFTPSGNIGNTQVRVYYDVENPSPTYVNLVNAYISKNTVKSFTAVSPIKKIEYLQDLPVSSGFDGSQVDWIGLYEGDVTIVDTGETVESDGTLSVDVNINDGVLNSMQHQSEITYVADTKTYIDNHIPDIAKWWTEEIYALPEKFGAVGNGVADDAQALADCIAYAIANNKAVRGYGTYKTSEPVDINGRYMDVYLKKIVYSGNGYAIRLLNSDCTFGFHTIESSGSGMLFQKDATSGCSRNSVKGLEIKSSGNCIDIDVATLYTTCEIRYLKSNNGHCINYMSGNTFSGSEYVFRDCSCYCPNGWVLYAPSSSKFYNFTVEGDCQSGIYSPSDCVCYGWRHTEQIGHYCAMFPTDSSGYDNGPLISFGQDTVSVGNASSLIYESCAPIFPMSVNTDNMTKITPQNPASNIDAWIHKSNNWTHIKCDVIVPYNAWYSRGSQRCIAKEILILNGRKIFVPKYETIVPVESSTYDLRYFDTNDIATFRAATKTMMASGFDIQENTTIYLNASYCAIGYNKITIHTNSHSVAIYDIYNNKIFDSGDYSGTDYELNCVTDQSNKGLSPSPTSNYWCYDGTNHVWTVKEL